MIIKIKKRSLIVTIGFLILIILIPFIYAVGENVVRRAGFKVELVITNRNPTINVSNVTGGASSFSVDPVAASTVTVLISFNVTDADGASDINASTAVVNFTLGGIDSGLYFTNISAVTTSEFGTCRNHSPSSTVVVINCTVVLPYFANASSTWVGNISVKDRFGGVGRNDTLRFTINTASGLALPYSFINFSSVNLGQQNVLAYPHLLLNNTGNEDYDMVNMSAAALVGTTVTTENIAVTNFFVNLTNSSDGNLALNFPSDGIVNLRDTATGGNVSFVHGHTSAYSVIAAKGNISAFIWVDVPTGGLSSQLYNATWNVTAINNP